MLRLNCFYKAHEGNYDQALQAALALTASSLNDEGNVAYDTLESATHPDEFLILETWRDEASLKAHMAAPHFKLYVDQLEALGTLTIEQFEF